jgi:NADH-quinone oxidoreductase subunit A
MTALVGYILLFVALGVGFIFINLLVGKLVRPHKPNPEKMTIYECGEPTIGSAWVQFDLRFYVVALLFVIFDVELAFFFPWAVVFGKSTTLAKEEVPVAQRALVTEELVPPTAANARQVQQIRAGDTQAIEAQRTAASQVAWIAFIDILIFFGVLLVGFAYLWRRGDLDWVRSTSAQRAPPEMVARTPGGAPPLVGAERG